MNTIVNKVSSEGTEAFSSELDRASAIIRDGGLVVFPTETVYGLGGNGLDGRSAEKIFSAKGRPADNPLILHVASPEEAERVAYTSPVYTALADAFMPGPLTVILPARDTVPTCVRAGLPTVAVRCPAHPVARELIRRAGVPIAAPSANLSGSPSATCASHVIEDMMGRVDMILDGGEADFGLESTIVKIEENGSLTLLRPGAITLDELASVVETIHVADAVFSALKSGETVLSPGMKYKHYAPKTQVLLLSGGSEKIVQYIKERAKQEDIAAFVYTEDMPHYMDFLPPERRIPLGDRNDLRGQAHRLFYLLREADKLKVKELYAPLPPKEGVGMALYNRMIRAAAYTVINLDEKGE